MEEVEKAYKEILEVCNRYSDRDAREHFINSHISTLTAYKERLEGKYFELRNKFPDEGDGDIDDPEEAKDFGLCLAWYEEIFYLEEVISKLKE